MTITTLRPEEWKVYKSLRLEGLKESPLAFGKTYEEEVAIEDDIWKDRLIRTQKGELWHFFAKHEDTCVGMIGGYRDPLKKFNHIVHIVSVYVRPEFRGMGIGKKLFTEFMNAVQKDTTVKKVKLMVVDSQDAAKHMYEAAGFRQVGIQQQELHHEGVYYDEIIMEKII